MALDIAILEDDGRFGVQCSLGVNEHWGLIQSAKPLAAFPLLLRLRDYYSDAEFGVGEVSALREELHRLSYQVQNKMITELIQLCDSAERNGKGIVAIAD